jgi:hypothetical protein
MLEASRGSARRGISAAPTAAAPAFARGTITFFELMDAQRATALAIYRSLNSKPRRHEPELSKTGTSA